ncbi:MAG TPA: galactokinase [Phycisphaerae bacterium]
MIERAISAFQSIYQRRPTAAALAPGRVEILGNHTDYNGGAVLAAAIDRHICMVGAPNDGRRVRVYSLDFKQTLEFELPDGSAAPPSLGVDWGDLIGAALYCLRRENVPTVVFDAVVLGNIPIAAGLSSSAALTVSTAKLAEQLVCKQAPGDMPAAALTLHKLAQLMQQAEHVGLGVRCGLLDPFTSIHGKQGALLVLDSALGSGTTVPLAQKQEATPAIVIVDSRTPRSLSASRYNERRRECERAFEQLVLTLPHPPAHLCQISLELFGRVEHALEPVLRRRARHVIGEHARVLQAVAALLGGNVARLGALMRESHSSSRVNFENSTERLDLICEVADEQRACLGSRLTGAGWGGCTLHLVQRDAADEFTEFVVREVLERSGATVEAYVTQASDGARAFAL